MSGKKTHRKNKGFHNLHFVETPFLGGFHVPTLGTARLAYTVHLDHIYFNCARQTSSGNALTTETKHKVLVTKYSLEAQNI
jgi:hypothetical protein